MARGVCMKKEEKKEQQKQRRQRERKEIDNMTATIRQNDLEIIEGMKKYIEYLKKLPKEEAKIKAKEALIRTGVLTEDGEEKESIVSWE